LLFRPRLASNLAKSANKKNILDKYQEGLQAMNFMLISNLVKFFFNYSEISVKFGFFDVLTEVLKNVLCSSKPFNFEAKRGQNYSCRKMFFFVFLTGTL
jgi:hypothetical protein